MEVMTLTGTRWSYRSAKLELDLSKDGDEVDAVVDRWLNDLGDSCWEVIDFKVVPGQGRKGWAMALLKRPKMNVKDFS